MWLLDDQSTSRATRIDGTAAPYLGVIAQLGMILYMFTMGLELHAGQIKHRAHATVATSHASILRRI